MLPRLERGCHCSMSLRACTITLASLQLLTSLWNLIDSFVIEFYILRDPTEVRDDLDIIEDDYFSSNETSAEWLLENDRAMEPETLHSSSIHAVPGRDYHIIVLVAQSLEIINLIFCLIDIIVSSVLIAGAAKQRATLIRPWLAMGAAFVIYDILYIVIHSVFGSHFFIFLSELMHIPFAAYLWIVAYSLYLDCKEGERRVASSPVCMSALVEAGDDAVDHCSVAYANLDKLY